jgi:ribosomal protein L40E
MANFERERIEKGGSMSRRLDTGRDRSGEKSATRQPSADLLACRWCGSSHPPPLKRCRHCGRYQIGGARYNYTPKRQRIAQHAEAMREDPQAQRRLKIAKTLRARSGSRPFP